jgi:hypothetical protein
MRYPFYHEHLRKGKLNKSIGFNTRRLACFTELYKLFYFNNKKIIPENIYEVLTPVAIAH